MQKRFLFITTTLLFSILILSGCLFKGEQSLEEEMDPPPNVETTDNLAEVGKDVSGEENGTGEEESTEEKTSETVLRELYLLDENGMVVPQMVPLPKGETNAVATQVLEYLIKDGPVTNVLPNGFQAVLPAGTEINGLDIMDDGTLVVDLSEGFKEYQPEEELQIIQAMTFTLTQFDTVDRIKLRINGVDQNVMPVNGTPLSNGYSRADGINIHVGDVQDVTNAEITTVYFPAEHDSHYYYVPVTMPVESEGDEMVTAVVNSLLEGPSYELAGLLSPFQSEVQLVAEPTMEDGVLTLTFNDAILNNLENQTISDEVLSSLVLSLTEQKGVESVQVKIEGVEQVFNEDGEAFSEPVTRADVTEASGI